MTQDDFAKQMEKAFKDALKQADAITADAERIRKLAEVELDAAKEAHRIAETEGEKMANEYYEGKRKQFTEAVRKALLRDLARMHLEVGKTDTEIAVWLDVPQDFVKNIRTVMERASKYRTDYKPHRLKLEGSPKLRYVGQGRGGTIWFESREGSFDMWWEFAGGIALAIVDIPTAEHWEARTKLPLERRQSVLTFIGEQIVEDQTAGDGSFIIGEDVLTIYGHDVNKQ